MAIYVSGSLAFDRIMTFDGNFQDHVLMDKLHTLSVSFMVDNMNELRGGCAGNIAYTLALLEEKPLIVASAGRDFAGYAAALEDLRTLIASAPAEPLLGNARLAEAYLLEVMGKTEEAARLFAELGSSMELASNLRAEANVNAGRLFIQLKKFDDAASALNRAVNPDRQSAAAWCSMAHSLLVALENGDFGPYKPAAKL